MFLFKVVPLWNIPLNLEFHKDLVKDLFYIFFNMSPLSDIAGKFNLSYNINADNKLYLSFKPTIPDNGDLAMSNIKSYVNEVNHWVLMSHLNWNKERLSYWHSLFNILHNHFFEISQLQMKPFTPCSIAAIFDSHFCLINILPIFANVWFNHLRNMNYTMRYQMRTTKVGSLQCSTLWLPNSTMKRLQHVQVKKATSA